MFESMENSQSDSKLFWAKAKGIMNGLRSTVSPPPMITVKERGGIRCETDPILVLKAWRKFSSEIANPGRDEEGKFDDEHKERTERPWNKLNASRVTRIT
jgi:hypothetical protein